MRFVEGMNLKQVGRRRGPPRAERAVAVIEQVAAALTAAHERGLVHRDVKPGNVLIEESTGRVYLTDFGLAKTLGDGDITDEGELLGTTRYIAPERSRGLGHDDLRGDIYSLGCLLWDLLGGIDRVSLDQVPGVPAELRAVVVRATELEPSARFASAAEMAVAARAALHAPAPAHDHAAAAETVLRNRRRRGRRRSSRTSAASRSSPRACRRGLANRVAALCAAVLEWLDPADESRPDVEGELAALGEPLRVAVVGPAGAGRSSLVNALLGSRVARGGDPALAEADLTLRLRHPRARRDRAGRRQGGPPRPAPRRHAARRPRSSGRGCRERMSSCPSRACARSP